MAGGNTIETTIVDKLRAELGPEHLEVVNESFMHNVPKGSETHFRVLVVSERFSGLSRVARQRLVNEILAAELKGGVHALSQRAYTPEEWRSLGGEVAMKSPPCHGGGKKSE